MLKIYRFLFILLSPFLKAYFYFRILCGKDRIDSIKNHFGISTAKRPSGKLLWIHAASVGESLSALTYINHIKKKYFDLNILLTTITVTSADILRSKIEKISNCIHQFVVADNPIWIKKFFDYWNVDTAIFLESEIWPNIIEELHERKIPIFLLNARLSPKSFRRWNYISGFISETLKKFNGILAQSEIDFERFSHFSPQNVYRIDNLKYANAILPCNEDLLKKFRENNEGRKIFVAASTHEGEEKIILEAHKIMKQKFDNIFTIIIPRHINRVKKICEEITSKNLRFFLRSEIDSCQGKYDVCLVDTFGEVGTFFRLANVCFVGGSLIPIGGHNIYEPVSLGKPVLHGPHMENALEICDLLHKNEVAFEVYNEQDISEICIKLFEDKKLANKIKNKALSLTNNKSLEQIDKIIDLNKLSFT